MLMKIRSGFVSNSSSSSFIVISQNGEDVSYELRKKHEAGITTLVVDGNLGHTEFGWERNKYNDFGSKLIFAYLQAHYLIQDKDDRGSDWLAMLEEVVKENLGVNGIEWNLSTELNDNRKTWAFIDHQSASFKGVNTEMFEDKKSLKLFLFNTYSYIETGNDNDSDYYEYQ